MMSSAITGYPRGYCRAWIINRRQFREDLTVFTASTTEGEKKWKRSLALAKAKRKSCQETTGRKISCDIARFDVYFHFTGDCVVVSRAYPFSSSLISYEGVTLMDGGDSSSSESDFEDETARVCSTAGFLGGV